jgi:hypothetical protein
MYCGISAYAQFLDRNYDEAMRLASDGIRQRGDFRRLPPRAHCRRRHGRPDNVTALQELRGAQPNISLPWIESQMPIKQDTDREHYLEGFRRAGLEWPWSCILSGNQKRAHAVDKVRI